MGSSFYKKGNELSPGPDPEFQEPAFTPPPRKPFLRRKYSRKLANRILAYFVEGMSLHKIADQPRMPSYNTMLRWAHEHEEFSQMLHRARAARALHHEQMAIEAAEAAEGKDDAAAQRLKFDAHKWAAEVGDASRYGKKLTHEGNPDKPVTFIIATGFPAPLPGQEPPKLGVDGLIEKSVESEVTKVLEGPDVGEETSS